MKLWDPLRPTAINGQKAYLTPTGTPIAHGASFDLTLGPETFRLSRWLLIDRDAVARLCVSPWFPRNELEKRIEEYEENPELFLTTHMSWTYSAVSSNKPQKKTLSLDDLF